jgi:hypothetical protein
MKELRMFLMPGENLDIFDLDETLFSTSAKVLIVDQHKNVIKELCNQSFNNYKLLPGESFDFSQFRSSSIFVETSQPILDIVATLKERYEYNKLNNGKTIIITARGDFNDKGMFLDFLRGHGLPVDDTENFFIYRTGNAYDDLSVAQRYVS